MYKLLLPLFLLFSFIVSAQDINCKVVDSITRKPLAYATIFCQYKSEILYADSGGYFSLPKLLPVNKDSLSKDSLIIDYLGYRRFSVALTQLRDNDLFKLVPVSTELATVVVSNCRRFRKYEIDKRTGGINDYLGPGPEVKIVIIGHYRNNKGKAGYIKQLEFYEGIFNPAVRVPVRLHWYKWDAATNLPGEEITKQNIILYPYTKGWNSFDIPPNSIYFSPKDIVLGLEFIYPVEFEKQFISLSTAGQQGKWLMNMNHRWSLGMETSKDWDHRGFYSINNGAVQAYSNRKNDLYIKPAMKFTIDVCEQ